MYSSPDGPSPKEDMLRSVLRQLLLVRHLGAIVPEGPCLAAAVVAVDVCARQGRQARAPVDVAARDGAPLIVLVLRDRQLQARAVASNPRRVAVGSPP